MGCLLLASLPLSENMFFSASIGGHPASNSRYPLLDILILLVMPPIRSVVQQLPLIPAIFFYSKRLVKRLDGLNSNV
jgi:hypothetical protein